MQVARHVRHERLPGLHQDALGVQTRSVASPFTPTPTHPRPPITTSRSLRCQDESYTVTTREPHSPSCETRFCPIGGTSFVPACFANSVSALPPSALAKPFNA